MNETPSANPVFTRKGQIGLRRKDLERSLANLKKPKPPLKNRRLNIVKKISCKQGDCPIDV